MNQSSAVFFRTQRFALAVALMSLIGGCASYDGPAYESETSASGGEIRYSQPTDMPHPDDRAAAIRDRFIVGPNETAQFNYRIDWQYAAPQGPIRDFSVQGDSVFVRSHNNFLSRVRVNDGERMWRVPVGTPREEIFGVTHVPSAGKAYVLTGSHLNVLDAGTGAQTEKQDLGRTANTPPELLGQYLIYGSRTGQVVWHSYPVAFQYRAYQVAKSIDLAPVVEGGAIVAVGANGRVMAIDASSGSQLWSKKLLDNVSARPTVGGGITYVAGLDQHIRAHDLATGRELWAELTQSRLDTSPTLIDDRVYQQIPSEGLACYEAAPLDAPGGKRIWTLEDVDGIVLTQHGDDTIAWDQNAREIIVIDTTLGAVVNRVPLPQVTDMHCTSPVNGDLYVTDNANRIIRLVPVN